MTVPIVENWTDISGRVLSCRPSETTAGFLAVEIAVNRVEPVEGFPNLLTGAAGGTLTVLVPAEVALPGRFIPEAAIDCRVRRGGLERVYVHRDHIRISPAVD